MQINIVGLGYIGLPTALMFAANGLDVCGVDIDAGLVRNLQNDILTFEEPGLSELFSRAKGHIQFTTAYQKSDIYIIAVPTPYDSKNKKVDASYLVDAMNKVLDVCGNGAIIIIESTVSPGTIDRFIRPIINNRCSLCDNKKVQLVHAPERIIPGNMIYELEHNSRTIGADSLEIGDKIKALYSSFCKGEIIVTDIKIAEMTKVVENTYRDINIAFANELAQLCRIDNMDVYEVIRIANNHPRVNILQPGPGVGGHCISVDPWFLVGEHPFKANMIHMARKINDNMPAYVINRMHEIMSMNNISSSLRVGIYGITYKEDVDDCRESPTLQLIENMKRHLSEPIKTYDPMLKRKTLQNQYMNFEEFIADIDMIVIMVGHTHLKSNIQLLTNKIVYDTRNVVDLPNTYKL